MGQHHLRSALPGHHPSTAVKHQKGLCAVIRRPHSIREAKSQCVKSSLHDPGHPNAGIAGVESLESKRASFAVPLQMGRIGSDRVGESRQKDRVVGGG